jgi:exopolysaccharide production protein ExoQ
VRAIYRNLEAFVIALVLAFPLFGTFMPIEIYLNPLTFQPLEQQTRVETYDFTHIVFLGVAALVSYLMLVHARPFLGEARRGILILMLVALALASAAWAPDPYYSFTRAARFVEYSVIGAWLAITYDVRGFTRLVTRVLAISVAASFLVIALRPELAYSNTLAYHEAIRGAAVSKNTLGTMMCFAVLASGYSLVIGANNRIFAGAVFIGSLVLLTLSRSATSEVATVAAAALALFGAVVRRRGHPGWASMGVALLLLGLAGAVVVFVYLPDILAVIGRSDTLTDRVNVWNAVIQAIRERPLFGYGYGFWEQPSIARNNIWLELGWAPPEAHSGWLDVALQLGLVGLAITVALWLVSIVRGFRLAFIANDPDALFLAVIVFSIFLRSISETVMLDPGVTAWIWFVFAYLHLARAAERARKRMPQEQAAIAPPALAKV